MEGATWIAGDPVTHTPLASVRALIIDGHEIHRMSQLHGTHRQTDC